MGNLWSRSSPSKKEFPADFETPPSILTNPFILFRSGSMFLDEDDDLAHEFYVEELQSGKKPRLRRVSQRRLRPQGKVRYPYPRINCDLPVVMYQT
ncbi:tumor suppressor candidate 2-like [Artemia franciscana]|uniref:Tumor suppressor candidate 2 n=1 Tax=Artemia franciscana TaxID=6661 RepID=A0AA88HJL2_ARTSF|nr:hypothetical protein QYM36_013778 [Artemia franciscana]KAK2710239.1 hypothetical protein QYM36_013778 [Artemia franciscana]